MTVILANVWGDLNARLLVNYWGYLKACLPYPFDPIYVDVYGFFAIITVL